MSPPLAALDEAAPAAAAPARPARRGPLALLVAMRPKQWSKNLILFAAFLFTLNEKWRPLSPEMWQYLARSAVAFAVFCLVSSGIYLINDLVDVEKDRAHPRKRHRPFASGALSRSTGVVAACVVLAGSLAAAWLIRPGFFAIALAYVVMQIAYSFSLKHMVILDVFVLAMGFVLRAVAGAVVISAAISPWLYIVTLLGALFLGLAKRRHELLMLEDDAGKHRSILDEYTPQLLDKMIGIVASATIMGYALYTFTSPKLPPNHVMMATIPLVMYGMFRYLYLVHRHDAGGSPEDVLFRDRPIIITVILWVVVSAGILAYFR
jgi:4-hydroxybenzoate polyprenyltransferase